MWVRLLNKSKPNTKTYKVSLPSAWINELCLGKDDRAVQLYFDGHQIEISKPMSFDEFDKVKKSRAHELKILSFHENNTLYCTTHGRKNGGRSSLSKS